MSSELAYGSWPSPITAELLAAGSVGLSGPAVRGDDVWWSELRPTDGGRVVPVSSPIDGIAEDRLAAPWSARTRVHEYGGGAWWLGRQHLYFASWDDQRLHRVALDPSGPAEPVALTPPGEPSSLRYADGDEHPTLPWVVCVRERHDTGDEPVNELVAISVEAAADAEPVVVVTGSDFVSDPRFSPDGRWMSWIEWDHPAMPWDQTRLMVAPVAGGGAETPGEAPPPKAFGVGQAIAIAGSDQPESIVGAGWLSTGSLVFSSDRTGWWNLYLWDPAAQEQAAQEQAAQEQAAQEKAAHEQAAQEPWAVTSLEGVEVGHPPWVFGIGKRWCELADGRLAIVITNKARDSLAVVGPPSVGGSETEEPIPVPLATDLLVAVDGLAAASDGKVVVIGSGSRRATEIMAIDVEDGSVETIRPAEDIGVDPGWYSVAQPITFGSGPDKARTAHAFYYPPTAPGIDGPSDDAPPLVVMGHGGPTSHANPGLRLKIQYWTSRGFAVADVNYGGSTGFGRDYKDLLRGAWGIVDVEDCIAVAEHLAESGLADADKLAIRGGSAGGFTVLAALQQSDLFGAGTNLFGVADLTALAADTHKFESRYLDGLIGPYPERQDLYHHRSPINHTDKLSSPLLVLQGLEDEIVPPNQSEAIVAAVAAKGIPHAYVPFEGEQHGFRKAENLIRSFEVELWFYGRVFGFDPADAIDPPPGAVGLG